LRYSDIELNAQWEGPPSPGRPVLALLHGFMGSGESWNPVVEGLRRIGAVLSVELAGHGASPAPDRVDAYTMPACLDQLEALLARLGIPSAWWVGYSMGGRVALQLAVHKPALVQGLVLESATAGLRDERARAERRQADEELAESILTDGMEAFTDRWLANPLFQGLKKLPPEQRAIQLEQRLRNNPLGLANSLRGMGAGAMEPVWQRLGEIEVPVLLMAGEEDAKFSAIARELAGALPRATLHPLPACGHTPHVESPAAFLATVEGFFGKHLASG
jgi:2-succinyl-6-hydroxy-2,4-cyclohexadiene-1-carboxylate synthase